MVFLWFSYGFPMVFLWFSCGFPMVFLWFSYGFPMVFLWFSYGFPMVFLWFSYGFPMVFLWFSYGLPMVFLWFSRGITINSVANHHHGSTRRTVPRAHPLHLLANRFASRESAVVVREPKLKVDLTKYVEDRFLR